MESRYAYETQERAKAITKAVKKMAFWTYGSLAVAGRCVTSRLEIIGIVMKSWWNHENIIMLSSEILWHSNETFAESLVRSL